MCWCDDWYETDTSTSPITLNKKKNRCTYNQSIEVKSWWNWWSHFIADQFREVKWSYQKIIVFFISLSRYCSFVGCMLHISCAPYFHHFEISETDSTDVSFSFDSHLVHIWIGPKIKKMEYIPRRSCNWEILCQTNWSIALWFRFVSAVAFLVRKNSVFFFFFFASFALARIRLLRQQFGVDACTIFPMFLSFFTSLSDLCKWN